MDTLVKEVLKQDPLVKLIQQENFIGWVYSIDYESALVMTNDDFKEKVLGIPHNCFLVASSFDTEKFSEVKESDKEVVLLRVLKSAQLPNDPDMIKAKIDHFQNRRKPIENGAERRIDAITLSQMQFHGLSCKVLGTFFIKDGKLFLGSDIESFWSSVRLQVYRPRKEALSSIVNYIDPTVAKKALEDLREFGITKPLSPFPIGTMRYTSTDRLHRGTEDEKVQFSVQPADFIARRTAVFGMTRKGKSNTVKQMVKVVKKVADEAGVKIGQIIFDIAGEYANANAQDKGAISEIYKADTIRYRMHAPTDFKDLRNNFYEHLPESFSVIRKTIIDTEGDQGNAGDLTVFLNMDPLSLSHPKERPSKEEEGIENEGENTGGSAKSTKKRTDYGEITRFGVKTAIYRCLLYAAGYKEPNNFTVDFAVSSKTVTSVQNAAGEKIIPSSTGKTSTGTPRFQIPIVLAKEWFTVAREANNSHEIVNDEGRPWLDDECKAMLNLMVSKNAKDNFIKGRSLVGLAKAFHHPEGVKEIAKEIYEYLKAGKIVILDLSVGEQEMKERISKDVARKIFSESSIAFNNYAETKTPPPNIAVYVEEAHNLIGKDAKLTDIWPKIAKEGGKHGLSLIYATQEPSSIHPNILDNTENWFVMHLNNKKEVKRVEEFYDFEDFGSSIIRAQDPGFARVKTLSSPFVIPVQIDMFVAKTSGGGKA